MEIEGEAKKMRFLAPTPFQPERPVFMFIKVPHEMYLKINHGGGAAVRNNALKFTNPK